MEQETCWTLIDAAAAGSAQAQGTFVERYLPAVRAYLSARWHDQPYLSQLEDAQQEVFLECIKDGGVLVRFDPNAGCGFRQFLYGVVRRTAQKFETQAARQWKRKSPGSFHPEQMPLDETSLSRIFDRTWAFGVIHEAGSLHQKRAREQGEDHERRVELLRLRFQEGQAIREIAAAWGCEAKVVHWEYARARKEFKDALREVLGLHERCPEDRLEQECDRVLELLR